jgi:hypothetical protein
MQSEFNDECGTCVNVLSFNFTGGTAIADWLSLSKQSVRFPHYESRFFGVPGGFERLIRKARAQNFLDEVDIASAKALLTGEMNSAAESAWEAWRGADWKGIWHWTSVDVKEGIRLLGAFYLDLIDDFIEELYKFNRIKDSSVENKIRMFTNGMQASLLGADKDVVVHKNLYRGFSDATSGFFPNEITLICDRDPRDQWTEISKRSQQNLSIDEFISMRLNSKNWALKDNVVSAKRGAVEKGEVGNSRFMILYFEDFINDAVVRKKISDGIGIKGSHEIDGRFYFPYSRNNIGIYKGFSESDPNFLAEIRKIESTFPKEIYVG